MCKNWTRWRTFLLDRCFPTRCFHCQQLLQNEGNALCSHCRHFLGLLPPDLHCQRCFALLSRQDALCAACQHRPLPFFYGRVCDPLGALASLRREYFHTDKPVLAECIAAFFVQQWLHANWSLPDRFTFLPLLPFPLNWWQTEPNRFLVQRIAVLLQIPWQPLLRRIGGQLQLTRKASIAGQRIAIIALQPFPIAAATALCQQMVYSFPRQIYVMTWT